MWSLVDIVQLQELKTNLQSPIASNQRNPNCCNVYKGDNYILLFTTITQVLFITYSNKHVDMESQVNP